MNRNQHTAVRCCCGGQARIFGPSNVAPSSHWGVYCSNDCCEEMAVAASLDEAIALWNAEQSLEVAAF